MKTDLSDWKLFVWAALHSPKFGWCYFKSPIVLEGRFESYRGMRVVHVRLAIRWPSIYLPYSVKSDYEEFHGIKPLYDEIPF